MKAQCLLCYDIIESIDEPDVCDCGQSFLDLTATHYRGGGYIRPIFERYTFNKE